MYLLFFFSYSSDVRLRWTLYSTFDNGHLDEASGKGLFYFPVFFIKLNIIEFLIFLRTHKILPTKSHVMTCALR